MLETFIVLKYILQKSYSFQAVYILDSTYAQRYIQSWNIDAKAPVAIQYKSCKNDQCVDTVKLIEVFFYAKFSSMPLYCLHFLLRHFFYLPHPLLLPPLLPPYFQRLQTICHLTTSNNFDNTYCLCYSIILFLNLP